MSRLLLLPVLSWASKPEEPLRAVYNRTKLCKIRIQEASEVPTAFEHQEVWEQQQNHVHYELNQSQTEK